MSALQPFAATSQDNTRVGIFWHTSTKSRSTAITSHGGETGGRTAYFGLDRADGRAAVVLSDVANPATGALGEHVLAVRK